MYPVKIKWTPLAGSKLWDIYSYIYLHTQSHSLAEKQIDRILASVQTLKSQSQMGPVEPLLKRYRKGHRYLVEGFYKIIYRVEDNIVFIIDVFHTSQHPRKIKKNKNR